MIEITCNDRLGKKVRMTLMQTKFEIKFFDFRLYFKQVRVKCNPEDTIGDLKKLISAQTGTKYDKIVLKKWYTIYKDTIRLCDCKFFHFTDSLIEASIRNEVLPWNGVDQIKDACCAFPPAIYILPILFQ